MVASKIKARHNPFATSRLESLEYRFENDSWDSFLDRLRSMNYQGALVGPEGVGKTTLLLELEKQLLNQGQKPLLIRLSGGRRNMPTSFWLCKNNLADVVLIDSAENLPWWQFQLLKLKCKIHSFGLVVTAHKEGLLPTLIRCRTSFDQFADLSEKLVGSKLEKQVLYSIYSKTRGNIRLAFLELYTDI
ncbi:MAG: hypothetical protein KIT34_03040 [Cyanobacteria bacterium TGS_CYA1]|nr:hypothetical protein [Cyanobacteria bacterium TGS_CYA1]